MTKGQQTRRGIVEKAAPLFNQKGYEGTSLSDLMDATGLQKGGIYRHFDSKEELAAAAARLGYFSLSMITSDVSAEKRRSDYTRQDNY